MSVQNICINFIKPGSFQQKWFNSLVLPNLVREKDSKPIFKELLFS